MLQMNALYLQGEESAQGQKDLIPPTDKQTYLPFLLSYFTKLMLSTALLIQSFPSWSMSAKASRSTSACELQPQEQQSRQRCVRAQTAAIKNESYNNMKNVADLVDADLKGKMIRQYKDAIEKRLRCLDCEQRTDQQSVFYRVIKSQMKDQTMRLVGKLRRKGMADQQILLEMTYVFGNHVVIP